MSGTVRKLVAAGALALSVPVSIGFCSPAQAAPPAHAAMSSSVRPEVATPFPRAASAENTAPWGLVGLFGLLGLLGLARRAPAPQSRRREQVADTEGDPLAQYRTAHESPPEDDPNLYPDAATEYRQGGQHAAPARHQQPRHMSQPPQQAPSQQAPQQPQPQSAQPASQRWPRRETDWRERESAAEPTRTEQQPPPSHPQEPRAQAAGQPQAPQPQTPSQPQVPPGGATQQQWTPIVQPGPDTSWQRPEPHPTDSATWHADRPHGEDPHPDWFGQAQQQRSEQPREYHGPADDAESEEGRRNRS